jgi:hypothetical protein
LCLKRRKKTILLNKQDKLCIIHISHCLQKLHFLDVPHEDYKTWYVIGGIKHLLEDVLTSYESH